MEEMEQGHSLNTTSPILRGGGRGPLQGSPSGHLLIPASESSLSQLLFFFLTLGPFLEQDLDFPDVSQLKFRVLLIP